MGCWLEGVVSYGRLAKTSWMCPPPKRNAGNSRHEASKWQFFSFLLLEWYNSGEQRQGCLKKFNFNLALMNQQDMVMT